VGAVRYAATGAPLHVGYRHCRSCRHHSGAAVAGMLVFRPENVTFPAGDVSLYLSSPGIERGCCGRCGTSLSWEGRGLMSLHIGTLDHPDDYPPTPHWRWEERCPWHDDAGTLPHVAMEYPN